MTHLVAVAPVLPQHRYAQREITSAFGAFVAPDGDSRGLLERLHESVQVQTRHLALPLEDYKRLNGFGAANDVFIKTALDLGQRALSAALGAAGLGPRDVDLLLSTSVTGIAAPSIDALMAPRIGLRSDVKRVPIFGLGCVAGAAGIARLHDYLTGHPDDVAVLLSVELCSLTVQRDDVSVPNLVASGLFGDGASCVVAAGEARHGSRPAPAYVLATRSRLYPDSERVMGFDVGTTGLRIVLDADVPVVIGRYVGEDVDLFLDDHGLTRDDIGWWVCHPGGPKVIDSLQKTLGLSDEAVALTRASLANIGNLSSASVLHVLEDTLRDRPPEPGSHGLLMAMGPGFCSELVLLRAAP
jgi:alkylresorcinol/alkylpyrone synthase